ncbi:DUF4157 domain-containing protein [Coleofasciculus sp. FACHB-501]|nr:DUF4157 domain-containing protein [Coleofasciculus sp. FACHB-501]
MRMLDVPTLQREVMPEEEEEKELQMKPMIQCQSAEGGMSASPDLEATIQQARGSGQPLAQSIREPMEQAFGADFSGVKIHTDAQSNQMNRSIQAKAFTTGQDIFFREGAYEPGSRGGQELIAHELTHVVQQNDSQDGCYQINRTVYIGSRAKSVRDQDINAEVQQRGQTYGWSKEETKKVASALKSENGNTQKVYQYDTWLDAIEDKQWKGDKNAEGSEVREHTFHFGNTLKNVLERIKDIVENGFNSAFAAMEGGFLTSAWNTLSGIGENLSEIALGLAPGVYSILAGLKKLFDLKKIGRLYNALKVAGAQELAGKVDQKVNRRWWDTLVAGIQKITKGALKIAALFTGPLAGGFIAAADIGDAIMQIGKYLYRGGKAIYKKLKGTKGQNRTFNARRLLLQGLAGKAWALDVLIAMDWRGSGVVGRLSGWYEKLNPLTSKNMAKNPELLAFNNAMKSAAENATSSANNPEAFNSARIDFQLRLDQLYGKSDDSNFRAAIIENVAYQLRSFA